MNILATQTKRIRREPAWEIAELFPAQGEWTEEDYFALPDTNRLIELANGCLEFPSMPTTSHHATLAFLYAALLAFTKPQRLGRVFFNGIRVQLWPGQIREPDLVFMLTAHAARIGEQFWQGADLVMEVVSGSTEDRRRDLRIKRAEYARARILEYWIIDPHKAEIIVLRLRGRKYAVHGRYRRGDQAKSALLKGFEVDVDAALTGE